jgi:hypothetical protein
VVGLIVSSLFPVELPKGLPVKQRLQQLLKELHTELGNADALDDQTKDQLRGLADEIEGAVGPDEDKSMGAEALSQLEEAAVDFEVEHPRLAGILGQITDTLSKLGI